MTSWIKSTFLDTLDTLGFGPEPKEPTGTSYGKRKASKDDRGPAKMRRYSDDAYRNAPYGTPGPLRLYARYNDEVFKTKAEHELEMLKAKTYSFSDARAGQLLSEVESGVEVIDSPIRGRPRTPKTETTPQNQQPARVSGVPSIARSTFSGVSSDVTSPPQASVQSLPEGIKPQMSKNKAKLLKKQLFTTTTQPSMPKAVTGIAAKVSKPWKQGMSNEEKWATQPNKRAREIATSATSPRHAISKEVQEPEYALRDAEIRGGLWHLMNLMERFAKKYFAFEIDQRDTVISESFFEQFSPETAKVIGCVASGGPGGVQGWHDLFLDEQKRHALVMAIIGNVLVEQVFQHIFFGGIAKHVKRLTKLQEEHKDEDGFDRNTQYATHVRSVLDSGGYLILPANFSNHVNYIVGVLYTHILPFLNLYPDLNSDPIPALHTLVTQAGLLSLSMRIDPHTVYHFEPVFKEDTFTSQRMECFNRKTMEQTNSRTSDTEPLPTKQEKRRQAGLPADEKKRAKNDDALTQITILNGVTAYRLGGWEKPSSTLSHVEYEDNKFKNKGIRARALTPGWVYCRWGRARRFKDGKPDDVPAAHGAAWHGGFKEFSDVKGVVDRVQVEQEERRAGVKGKAAEVETSAASRHSVASPGSSARHAGRVQEDDLQVLLNEESSV